MADLLQQWLLLNLRLFDDKLLWTRRRISMSFLDQFTQNKEFDQELKKVKSKSEVDCVHWSEVRYNPQNIGRNGPDEENLVEQMAECLRNEGQLHTIVVYRDETLGDGKKYTLLSGERRTKAAEYNEENFGIESENYDVQNKSCDGMLMATIIPKPETSNMESLLLIEANNQTSAESLTEDNKREIVKKLAQYFEEEKSAGRLKYKGLKRDWIAGHCCLAPRTVQNYLTGKKSDSTAMQKNLTQAEEEEMKQELEAQKMKEKEIKEYCDTFARNASNYFDCKVKMNKKYAITIEPSGKEDLEAILMLLNLNEDGTEISKM